MDAKQHERFVHGKKNSAFMFAAPLLIEAGFPINRTMIEHRLDRIPVDPNDENRDKGRAGLFGRRTLHPAEKLYFEK